MVIVRLGYVNTKRMLRHRGLRIAFAAVPLAVALGRAAFAKSAALLVAARLCPLACAVMVGAVLYAQWSVDSASGLIGGLRASPVGGRGIVISRVVSGGLVLVVQMAVFVAILAVRF
jgi:hypothetical protein